MLTFESLHENFTFLVLEVQGQLDATLNFLARPTLVQKQQISLQLDRIANMQTVVETKCYSKIAASPTLPQSQVNKLRAMQSIAVHLTMISEFFVNITRQTRYLTKHSKLDPVEYFPFFDEIKEALELILPTLEGGDLSNALAICRSEHTLDDKYNAVFSHLIAKLDAENNAAGHITVLFIYRYLERIGDSLQRIGEALIFATVGNTLKISQFDSLQQTLSKSGFTGSMSEVDYKAILGSRSGCRIGVVETLQQAHGTSQQGSIYKEGSLNKIRREKNNLKEWQQLFPTLVPNIYGYHEGQDTAAVLIELLQGVTLDEIILQASEAIVDNALQDLKSTVRDVWETTKKDSPIPTNYIQQLFKRLSPVMQVHPNSVRSSLSIGSIEADSTFELLEKCSVLENELSAPFSVLTHGDLNMNNIVYNHQLQPIRFIDLYRSRNFDYVQDTSVFLVSVFRLPVFDPVLRDRLDDVTNQFYSFARSFASDHFDHTFDSRLAFALARSFYTSTRFELNQDFAKRMYLRAHFLMENLLEHKGSNWEDFTLPEEILFY